jgi:hypothetical protein
MTAHQLNFRLFEAMLQRFQRSQLIAAMEQSSFQVWAQRVAFLAELGFQSGNRLGTVSRSC